MRRRFVTPLITALGLLALPAGLPAQAVINGKAAQESEFPFMAAIQTAADDFAFCGGSIISSEWVLTAAHCMYDENEDLYEAADLEAVTGRTDLGNESTGEVIAVSEIHLHPKWDGTSWDAALLRLSTPTSSPAIALATDADDDLEAVDTPVKVAGWGDRAPTLGALATNKLQHTDLKVVSDSKCRNRNFVYGFNADTGVCAGEFLTDSCYGDSGGPLWGVKNGGRVQIGIVSYGVSCAVPDFPGVYSEVNNIDIRAFITQVANV